MRVLIATFHRNVIGGTEKYVQNVIPGLLAREHSVALLYEEPVNPARERIDSDHLIPVKCLAESSLPATLDWIAEWRPDVVFSQGLASPELESALLGAHRTVLFAHGYYGTCGSGNKCHSFPGVQVCERTFGPACLLLHYPRRCGAWNPAVAWKTYRRQAQQNATLRDYDAVVVASSHMRREYLRHGVDPARLRVCPCPLSDQDLSFPEPGRRSPRGNILMVSRLTHLKGGHHLIPAVGQASKRLGRPLRLTVAGDGPQRQLLIDLARECNVTAEFPGWIDRARRLELMREADLVAVPSLWPEPFGLTGLEGFCLGVPAVGYAVGGIPDWLIAGETGELADGEKPSVEGLASALVRALSDPDHYARLSTGAWQFTRRFGLQDHIAALEPVLEQVSERALSI